MGSPELHEMHVTLTRIDERLGIYITVQSDHEIRMRRMERFMWGMTGGAAVGGGIIGALITQLIGA
jgi:prolipoprotein diacylglyceryltransferase